MSKTKLPSIPAAPSDATSGQRSFFNSLKEIIEVWKGDRGDALDGVVTFRDLSVTPGTVLVANRSTGGVNIQALGTTIVQDFTPPTIVTNLVASGVFTDIIVTWDPAAYSNHAFTEVWRFTADTLASKTLIGTTRASVYVDGTGEGRTYYYWARHVSTAGVAGNFLLHGVVGNTQSTLSATFLTDLSIATSKLGDLSVGNTKLADFAVTSAKIDNLAVTNSKIDNLAVDNAKIGNLAVTSAKIDNLAVTDAKIATLTAAKITAGTLNAGESITVGTGGNRIIIDSYGNIRTGSATAFANGSGFWIGEAAGAAVFFFGNSASQYIAYNGVNLVISTPQFTLQNGNATFSGSLAAANGSFTGNLSAVNGTLGHLKILSGGEITSGDFTSYAWPAAGGTGFYLGTPGLLLGNYNNNSYVQLTKNGEFFMGNTVTSLASDASGFRVNGPLIATGNILNDAITITSTVFTASQITLTNTAQIVQSLVITTTGNKVLLLCSFDAETAISNINATVQGRIVFDIYMDGVILFTTSGARLQTSSQGGSVAFTGTGGGSAAFNYSHTPAAGGHTYQVYAGLLSSTTITGSVNSRSMFAMEIKR